MREITLVLAMATAVFSCVDHAGAAAVAKQERRSAELRAGRAEAAAVAAAEAAAAAEALAALANSRRDVLCSCSWAMVQSDPQYTNLRDRLQVVCRPDCKIQRVQSTSDPGPI